MNGTIVDKCFHKVGSIVSCGTPDLVLDVEPAVDVANSPCKDMKGVRAGQLHTSQDSLLPFPCGGVQKVEGHP